MKFFTRAWLNGEMSEEQFEAVPGAYWNYLASLHLPQAIEDLAEVNLHDAILLGVEYQGEKTCLTLQLRCGDLQKGYSDVYLTFLQVAVDRVDLGLLHQAKRPAPVEVLYDEVDRWGELFDFRLIFYPDGESTIRFREVEIRKQPVPDRQAE